MLIVVSDHVCVCMFVFTEYIYNIPTVYIH